MLNLYFLYQQRSKLKIFFLSTVLLSCVWASLVHAQEARLDPESLNSKLDQFSARVDSLAGDLSEQSQLTQQAVTNFSEQVAEIENRFIGIEGEITTLTRIKDPSWLERYQTLITGVIAIVTALISISGARRRDKAILDQKRSSLAMSLAVEMKSLSASLKELQASLKISEIEDQEKLRFTGESLEHVRLEIYGTLIGDIGILGEDIATAATKVSYGLGVVKRVSASLPSKISSDHAARLISLVSKQIDKIEKDAGSVDSLVRKRFS